jgi:hypothetical protein
LPTADDRDRYRAESGARLEKQLRVSVLDLLGKSLLDGHEHAADILGAELGIQVKGDGDRDTYVAVRIVGSVPEVLLATVPEFAMPDRPLKPGEQVYSNVMDCAAAARLLESRDAG